MRTALSVAGFDPVSGAGITSDIKVFQSLKVYGVGVVSSITAQNTLGLYHVGPVPRSVVKKQLHAILDDVTPHAAKIGMIYDKGLIKLICSELDNGRLKNVVVDPVILSSTGKPLIKKDALKVLIHHLIPRSRIVTPNIHEAATITGIKISGIDDMYRAAEKCYRFGVENVVIKGGHLNSKAVDVLFDGKSFKEFRSEKRRGWYHGTGCVFSAAMTACLASGKTVPESVRSAKTFIKKSIEKSHKIGKGMRLLGT